MNLININPLTKRRIEIMTKSLIPWVGYVKVTYSGLAILKTSRWSLRKTKLSITDLCLHELPKRISHSASKNNMGKGHILLFRDVIAGYLELNFGNRNYDLVEYVWEIFNKYHLAVPSITIIPCLARPIGNPDKYYTSVPALTITSYNNFHGIHKIFKNFNKQTIKKETNRLIKKIKSIQNNLPAMIINKTFAHQTI